jgi:hypothetical protein
MPNDMKLARHSTADSQLKAPLEWQAAFLKVESKGGSAFLYCKYAMLSDL